MNKKHTDTYYREHSSRKKTEGGAKHEQKGRQRSEHIVTVQPFDNEAQKLERERLATELAQTKEGYDTTLWVQQNQQQQYSYSSRCSYTGTATAAVFGQFVGALDLSNCLLYTSPSPRD